MPNAKSLPSKQKKKHLKSFEHDGVYNTTHIKLDETIILAKTMVENNKYRIVASDGTEDKRFIFKVLDQDKNVIYTNVEDEFATHFDFVPEETEQYLISVDIISLIIVSFYICSIRFIIHARFHKAQVNSE